MTIGLIHKAVMSGCLVIGLLPLNGCHRHSPRVSALPASVTPPPPTDPSAGWVAFETTLTPTGPHSSILTLDDAKVIGLMPEGIDMLHFLAEPEEITKVRLQVRSQMTPEDLALDMTIRFVPSMESTVDAYADYGDDGKKQITISEGLFRDIGYLAAAQALSYEHEEPGCFVGYARYITYESTNTAFTPSDFAIKRPSICPKGSIAAQAKKELGQKRLEEYRALNSFGLMFVILHEFAHFKFEDLKSDTKKMSSIRQREVNADAFAIAFMLRMQINPLAAMPVLSLLAGVEDRTPNDRDSDHPSAEKRMQLMVKLSKKGIKSKAFKEKLSKEGPNAVEQSEDITNYANALLRDGQKRISATT
jgi:hypothetical protein